MPPMKPKKDKPDDEPELGETPREVLYETEEAEVFKGENALTVEQAKHLLGWEEEPEGEDWGSDYFLVDEYGKKVRLKNNLKNRSYRPALADKYVQEHLQRRWQLNGETVIIGRYGETMDGQHRLISLVLAEQRRRRDAETHGHWVKNWPEPVTMQCVVVTGIDESDAVANSINVGDPRSLGDVLYRSEHFADEPPSRRKLMARAADYAIRFHWHRTGAGMDAWAPRRTHAEALDHLDRHPRLIRCLRHVVKENVKTEGGRVVEDNRLSRYLSLGYMSALMYLMGSGRSDQEAYRLAEPAPSERRLDWTLYKRAEEFMSKLAGSLEFQEVRYAMAGDPTTGSVRNTAERTAVIVRAWRRFADPGFKGFVESDPEVHLGEQHYQLKDDVRILTANPTCGGIDLGEPRDAVTVQTPKGEEAVEPEETEELVAEVEAEVEAIREESDGGEEGGKGVGEVVTAARREWPGRLIAFLHRDHYRVWGKDADTVAKVTGCRKDPKLKVDGLQYLRFKHEDFPAVAAQLVKVKYHVVVVKLVGGKPELIDGDYDPEAKPAKRGGKK